MFRNHRPSASIYLTVTLLKPFFDPTRSVMRATVFLCLTSLLSAQNPATQANVFYVGASLFRTRHYR